MVPTVLLWPTYDEVMVFTYAMLAEAILIPALPRLEVMPTCTPAIVGLVAIIAPETTRALSTAAVAAFCPKITPVLAMLMT